MDARAIVGCRYRRGEGASIMNDGDHQVIRIRVDEVSQLFDSLDPFPFHERDLDANAEEFIVGWVANWKPLEIFLYDWWPLTRRRDLYRRLARAEISISTDAE